MAGTPSTSSLLNSAPTTSDGIELQPKKIQDGPNISTHSDQNGEFDLEKDAVLGGEKAAGPNTSEFEVGWANEEDPANPLNWTSRKKWSNIAILSAITFLTSVIPSPSRAFLLS